MVLKRMLGGSLEKASKEMTNKMGKSGEVYMFFLGVMMLILKFVMFVCPKSECRMDVTSEID